MSSKNAGQQSVYSSTTDSDTPSAIEIMSTTQKITGDPHISSSVYRNALKSFQDVGEKIARLGAENKRLKEHNTAIKKELKTLSEHYIALEKELEALVELNAAIERESATLKEENLKLSRTKDVVKGISQVKEEKAGFQKELDRLGELGEVRGLKRKCEELEELGDRTTESQARMEKVSEDHQQERKKRIADIHNQSQKKPEQEIGCLKAVHSRQIENLTSVIGIKGLEDIPDGYIFRAEPFKRIPNGMIQVTRAEAIQSDDRMNDGLPCEDMNTRFLYVVRDQYRDFKVLHLNFTSKTQHQGLTI
ncbi:hypothetical protein BZA77DRAFT_366155 [Pyronema omphalodes]|nr:hypothetical protein BZA77DRAFT_366155 [Pyronema omphalodes]